MNDSRSSHRAGQFPILKRRLAPDDYLDIGCCACGRVWRAESVVERISCSDDLNGINAPCFAATYEGWVKP